MKRNLSLLTILTFLVSCQSSVESNQKKSDDSWLIPIEEVTINDLRDFIPPIENPEFKSIGQSTIIFDNNFVNVVQAGNTVKIYPQQITNWHEVVNDQIGDWNYSLTFCPVTGSVLTFDRIIGGEESTFGVSGMVFRGNLILYDRQTESFWSQMLAQCVNGHYLGQRAPYQQSIEMNFELATILFPDAQVLSSNTGYDFPYQLPTNSKRLPGHERYWGAFIGDSLLLFAVDEFIGENVVHNVDRWGEKRVVFGGDRYRFLNGFSRVLEDGTVLEFSAPDQIFPAVLKDQEGNLWDVFGNAIKGSRKGEKLAWMNGYLAFLFAWQDIYPDLVIWKNPEGVK